MVLKVDMFGVLAIAVGVCCLVEFVQWVIIYRCGGGARPWHITAHSGC